MDTHYGRKRSGIKRELIAKISEWINSITDENVQKLAKENTIVTGGSIASMLLGEKINDFDVYFRDKHTALAVATYYTNLYNATHAEKIATSPLLRPLFVKEEKLTNLKGVEEDRVVIYIKSAGVAGETDENADEAPYQYFETISGDENRELALMEYSESLIVEESQAESGEKYRPIFLSQNAITLSHKIQIIIRFYGEPDQIHDNYDFVHAKCYWDHGKGILHLPAEALEALLSRTLIYQGSLYPIASIFRMKKFVERGWRITAGQLLKIMWQISEINMKDVSILREQLTGVDMAYMYKLIEALKSTEPEKMNSDYIATIIDRIFE
jgi:hypothetical protein